MPKSSKSNLKVVATLPGPDLPKPSVKLGKSGMSLWRDIVEAYEFSDRASYETLSQACAACDRAEACREQIDDDGELLQTSSGWREHPLLKHEIAQRSFIVRTLARLGLDLEPLRAGPGRPPGR